MNLFNQMIARIMKINSELTPLRVVVEKEILHHDILRELSGAGFLDNLTFIGGTCLRACYGSKRLSEDLDFTGGAAFKRETLNNLAGILIKRLEAKYGLKVAVKEPQRETGNVDTWRLKVITRPELNSFPAQKINIDICTVTSHERRPMMLRNHYGIDLGTGSLLIQAQSREEILADKLIAFALRANRLKNRDLWDIVWLKRQGVDLPLDLISKKFLERKYSRAEFLSLLNERKTMLQNDPLLRVSFVEEMKRFLPGSIVAETIENKEFWNYLTNIVCMESERIEKELMLP
ncbi:MAG: nucleotidyl transferase AbiEii/AbiGii toxin family protein [Deltaproteobacteria bacterium]|nr:nucleotidyl transferase AbiEii/AbiGii toxin family protein [Deltaproteobacteria bacterium]